MKIETLSRHVLEALRERGHSDERIEKMSPEKAFDEYCNWHGLIEWGPQLRGVAETLGLIPASGRPT